MPNLDFDKIIADCIGVAKTELGNAWKNLKPYAEYEFRQFSENAAFLAQLKLTNSITDDELKARLNIQRQALNNVLLTIEGIGLIAAQNVVNAVLGIVLTSIKTTLNITLPI